MIFRCNGNIAQLLDLTGIQTRDFLVARKYILSIFICDKYCLDVIHVSLPQWLN